MIGVVWLTPDADEWPSVRLTCDQQPCPRSIGHQNAVLARRDAVVLGWQVNDEGGGRDLCPEHREVAA